MKDYNKANIPLVKDLRKNTTPWERKLWYELLRNYPVRFQRQKAIGDYIADFYCAKARLNGRTIRKRHHSHRDIGVHELNRVENLQSGYRPQFSWCMRTH